MDRAQYYQEAFEIALNDLGLWHLVEQMTPEQRAKIGGDIESAAENVGLAFYSPPAGDRLADVSREWERKLSALQQEFEAYRNGSERAMKLALGRRPDDNISIGADGSVHLYNGRTVQLV